MHSLHNNYYTMTNSARWNSLTSNKLKVLLRRIAVVEDLDDSVCTFVMPKDVCLVYLSELNRLSNSKLRTIAIIANTDNSGLSGEHWVAFYKLKGSTKFEFFDSYSMPPEMYGFCCIKQTIIYNTVLSTPLQSLTSKVCGGFCLMWLAYKIHKKQGFYNNFMKYDRVYNDGVVRNFLTAVDDGTFSFA